MGNTRSKSSFNENFGSHHKGSDKHGDSPDEKTLDAPPMTDKSGAAGLVEMGFEYRLVPCKDHTETNDNDRGLCFECCTALFHVESGTLISVANRKEYVPDGPIFEVVSKPCQEIAQERVVKECCLKFVTLWNDEKQQESIQALVEQDFEINNKHRRPTFLFITGKGKSRTGVISVKEVLESGIEKGSALFFLQEAQKRGYATICVDPNALGEPRGMETIDRSLTALFGSWDNAAPLYILAHSAAGGYLVRYLLLGSAKDKLVPNIRAIAFTDSTHRIQWTRTDPNLFSFLQSSSCLYIRNDAAFVNGTFERRKHAETGQEAQVDIWWHQRFGELRTVWAGTTSHSGMCWVARQVIWDLFDANTPSEC